MTNRPTPTQLLPDNPITSSDEDVLGWKPVAEEFARRVQSIDASQRLVVGLFGSWGSGKTSFINLAKPAFEGVDLIQFNPWLFSGADELVWRFFSEISAAMEKKSNVNGEDVSKMFRELGLLLADAAPSLLRLIGASGIGEIVSAFLNWLFRKDQSPVSAMELRHRLDCALKRRDKPIVVVLDDVDRLPENEIRELFKLVRLTASFPNVIYIVACDRTRVEKALQDSESGYGPHYLEKVFQWFINVPTAPRERLRQQLLCGIEEALGEINPPFGEHDWPDIEAEVIRPLVRNMRDVRRFSITLSGAVDSLGASIALVDFLALEAVRLFMPTLFHELPHLIDVLTIPPSWEKNEERMAEIISESIGDKEKSAERRRAQLDEVLKELDPEHQTIAHALIHRVFPVARDQSDNEASTQAFQLLKDNRVAHRIPFRLYLTRVEDGNLACSTTAKRVFEALHDQQAIDTTMRSQDPERWTTTILLLGGMFVDEFVRDHAEPALCALWDLLTDMPKPQPGVEDVPMMVLSLLTEDLLATLVGSDDAVQVIERVVFRRCDLTSKVAFLKQVNAFAEENQSTVSDARLRIIKERLNNEILSANVDDLAVERHPARVLLFSTGGSLPEGGTRAFVDHPKLAFAVLWDCQAESGTSEISSRARETQRGIQWDSLVKIHGDQRTLKARIDRLAENLSSIEPWIVSELGIPLSDARRLVELARTEAMVSRSNVQSTESE
ncbi:MAG: P-loop NTPase fold protein [Gammaproteobacteria bacterium]|nr:P-loop NTPase fold protein [Gammaproteobacteria bacterium]